MNLYYKSFAIKSNSLFILQFLLYFLIFDKVLTNLFANFPIFTKFQIHLTWNLCYVFSLNMYSMHSSWNSFLVGIFNKVRNFCTSHTKRTFLFLVYDYIEDSYLTVFRWTISDKLKQKMNGIKKRSGNPNLFSYHINKYSYK